MQTAFNNIKALVEAGNFNLAIDECDKLLLENPDSTQDILRFRAFVYAASGDHKKSMADREKVLSLGQCLMKDYYLAAEQAIYTGDFIKATNWLQEVLRLGDAEGDAWFESASRFLLSYAHYSLGNYSAALIDLEKAVNQEHDIAMPLPINESSLCTHAELKELILGKM